MEAAALLSITYRKNCTRFCGKPVYYLSRHIYSGDISYGKSGVRKNVHKWAIRKMYESKVHEQDMR